ncbi:hypothetical protein KKB99_07170 [bacterium]|nr:hypothetical protein [bacterium]MBU1025772.1 hypothetical protein [bacterium]
MRLFVIVAVLFFLLAYPLFSQDTNSGSFGSDILTTGEIQPGMKGYGLTTLKGNEIVRYPVEIISVMGNRGTNPHFRSILIRIDDDEFPDNWVGFNSDMAGSPIYVNGRLIGAVSTFYDWSMQEIAQVRPIEEMHMISDRQRNHNENDQAFQRKTLLDNNDAEPKNLQVDKSGLDNSANQQSNSIRPLRPGDAVAAIWSIGDYTQYEMGNITYISDNNEFYAFGKSVFNRAGTINAPLVRADVLNTMEGFDRNFQVANPELIVGTIYQDRSAGVYGKLGVAPKLIPVETTIHDVAYGKNYKTLSMVLNDGRFYPELVVSAVSHSIRKQLDVSWEGTIDFGYKITYQVDSGSQKIFGARDMFFQEDIPTHAVADLELALNALADNDFGKIELQNVEVELFWIPSRETGRIESFEFVGSESLKMEEDRFIVKPGDTIKLKVGIRPFKKNLIEMDFYLNIDDEFPTGDAVIQIRGGSYLLPKVHDITEEHLKEIEEKIKNSVKILTPDPPAGLEDLLSSITKDEPSNQLILELISTATTPLRGDELYNQVDKSNLEYVIYGFDSILLRVVE